MERLPLPERRNQIQHDTGYFSKAFHHRMKPSAALERRVGYAPGRPSEGGWLMLLMQTPAVDRFEVRGYSHLPAGKDVGGTLNSERSLRASGHELTGTSSQRKGIEQGLIENAVCLSGHQRLARIRPVRYGDEYPPGDGIPQRELTRPLPRVAAELVGPGEMYRGNYD